MIKFDAEKLLGLRLLVPGSEGGQPEEAYSVLGLCAQSEGGARLAPKEGKPNGGKLRFKPAPALSSEG